MKIPALSAMAALAVMNGLEPGMYDSLPTRRVRKKKEFTHFDQERIDKAEEKCVRKAAKRLRDTKLA